MYIGDPPVCHAAMNTQCFRSVGPALGSASALGGVRPRLDPSPVPGDAQGGAPDMRGNEPGVCQALHGILGAEADCMAVLG